MMNKPRIGIQGGNVLHGALMGLAVCGGGEAMLGVSRRWQGARGLDAAQLGIMAVVGGTIAELGGGNFANGAMTAAFAFLFNDLRHIRERSAIRSFIDISDLSNDALNGAFDNASTAQKSKFFYDWRKAIKNSRIKFDIGCPSYLYRKVIPKMFEISSKIIAGASLGLTAYEIYQNNLTINASHVVSTALTVAAILAGGWTVGLALGATYLAADLISRGFYSVSLDNQINSWAHQNIGIRGSINIGFTIKYDF